MAEVKARVSKDKVAAKEEVTEKTVKQSLDLLSGATKIVWPMGLPPTDPVSGIPPSPMFYVVCVSTRFCPPSCFLHFAAGEVRA